jgi:hypothetical protein
MIWTDNAKEYTKHPEGQCTAVCVDIVDLGIEDTQYGPKPKVRVVFETEQMMEHEDGSVRPMLVSRKFTASLNEKAPLRAFLDAWRGRKLTAAEAKAFDPEQLIGVSAYLNVTWEWSQDGQKQFDNIQSCVKLPRGLEVLAPSGQYTRVKDRPQPGQNGAQGRPPAGAKGQGRTQPAPARSGAPAPRPIAQHAQRTDKAMTQPGEFRDFPGALQDEDDDLPF